MAKITVVESWYGTPNGEGPLSGRLDSSVWIRVAKCPFTCMRFNNPDLEINTLTNEGLGFDPTLLKSLDEMPEITVGCDSIYAWDDRFSHLWKTYTTDELAEHVTSLLPHGSWVHPKSHQRYGLTLTGGEPTSVMKAWVEFIKHPALEQLNTITFETNCAVPLMPKHMAELRAWSEAKEGRTIVWSNSPKLSISGEPWEKAIVPTNALMQRLSGNFYQYFKFVCAPNKESFEEVERAMDEYHASGIPMNTEVWIMPVGCSIDQQQRVTERVTRMAMDRGYHVAWRNHIMALGNKPGV
jgi:organic radical activating enzyme